MGYAIDKTNPQIAYIVPMICFLVVAYYGRSVNGMTKSTPELQPVLP